MSPPTCEEILRIAVQHHHAGRLRDAQMGYRKVLAAQPDHADALHMLGVLAIQTNQPADAVQLLERAVAFRPSVAAYHGALAAALAALDRSDEAIRSVVRAAELEPQNPAFQFNLGTMLNRGRRYADAIPYLRRAIELSPGAPEGHHQLALALIGIGDTQLALDAFGRALAIRPDDAKLQADLGTALHGLGRFDQAAEAHAKAAALAPSVPEYSFNLGLALHRQRRLEEAASAYRRALSVRSAFPEALSNLGEALRELKRIDEAIHACREAIALRPDFAAGWAHLGNALRDSRQPEQAIACYRKSLQLHPNLDPGIHDNLAEQLRIIGQLDEATDVVQQALANWEQLPDPHLTLANLLYSRGKIGDAIGAYQRLIERFPDLAPAHYNLGTALLLRGDYRQGWDEYEWRWKAAGSVLTRHNFTQPPWDGSELGGKRVLIFAEQGFGDTIQFARFIPQVAARGGRTIFACQPELLRLLASSGLAQTVVPMAGPLPSFDAHCPLLSLARLFKTDSPAQVPANVPYIYADPHGVGEWRERLQDESSELKVGLVWAGSVLNTENHNRSLALSRFAALAEIPGVRFFSLQKGAAAQEAASPPAGMRLTDWTGELSDFADTAALLANMDLLITIESVMAHLAGAMGKKVWVLLPFVPAWRWMLERKDSPWYPTMRLFRQPALGAWETPMREVARELELLSEAKRDQ